MVTSAGWAHPTFRVQQRYGGAWFHLLTTSRVDCGHIKATAGHYIRGYLRYKGLSQMTSLGTLSHPTAQRLTSCVVLCTHPLGDRTTTKHGISMLALSHSRVIYLNDPNDKNTKLERFASLLWHNETQKIGTAGMHALEIAKIMGVGVNTTLQISKCRRIWGLYPFKRSYMLKHMWQKRP